MLRLMVAIPIFCAIPAWSQTKITWKTLEDARWSEKYSEEVEAYYFYPEFGTYLRDLEGTEVILKGRMLVLGSKEKVYILSRYPYASCFFCGSGGPDSIVELHLKPGHPTFQMDQRVAIKGKLKLNQDDLDHCNYILTEAELYKRNQ